LDQIARVSACAAVDIIQRNVAIPPGSVIEELIVS